MEAWADIFTEGVSETDAYPTETLVTINH